MNLTTVISNALLIVSNINMAIEKYFDSQYSYNFFHGYVNVMQLPFFNLKICIMKGGGQWLSFVKLSFFYV